MTASSTSTRDRLIVALDLPSVDAAEQAVHELGDAVGFYKIGYELVLAGGLDFAAALARAGKRVFLDLKLHDIATTVAHATERVAALGASFLTVHAYPPTMRAALQGRGDGKLKLLAVTVLTSWGEPDVANSGYALPLATLVEHRARQAQLLKLDGVVASAAEAAQLRRALGSSMLIVTPGIRPAGAETGDQQRAVTPAAALAAGADYLVVGRPIIGAPDRKAAAAAILNEMQQS